MKYLKKITCACLTAALSLSALMLPAYAAEVKYPEASSTDAAAWYLYGDIDMNGKVNSQDARAVLRAAAYIDPSPEATSLQFGAADYDRDGRISSRDARLILRVAAKLDAPANQPAHPYANKTTLTGAEALTLLRQANVLKTAEGRKAYKVTENIKETATYIDKDISGSLAGLLVVGGMFDKEMTIEALFDELIQTMNNTSNTSTEHIPYGTYADYNNHLQLKGDSQYVIGPNADPNTVSSAKLAYNTQDNTYTVTVQFKNETMSQTSGASKLSAVNSDIPTVEDLSAIADIKGFEGASIELSATFTDWLQRKTTYNLKNIVDNVTISYTFNAVTNEPINATYTMNSNATVPATINIKQEGISGTIKFAMNALQTITTTYDFHG